MSTSNSNSTSALPLLKLFTNFIKTRRRIMTTYIPSITIPTAVFQHPAASVLLPIALGTAVGFSTRRK